jgi:MerR family transcriptional regulator/heat shock protein HspR
MEMVELDIREPVYNISVAAKLVGVHPRTLRIYEEEGLIKPARSEGNTRLYSQHDLERLHHICYLTKEKGVNLAGVKLLLKVEEKLNFKVEEVLEEKKEAL